MGWCVGERLGDAGGRVGWGMCIRDRGGGVRVGWVRRAVVGRGRWCKGWGAVALGFGDGVFVLGGWVGQLLGALV